MGQTYFASFIPIAGFKLYVMPKFDFIQMLDAIQRFKVVSSIASLFRYLA